MVELVFMMLILKLPIVYLVAVCWWAIRAEQRPPEPAIVPAELRPGPRRPGARTPRTPRRGGPHGRLPRARTPGTASARAARRS